MLKRLSTAGALAFVAIGCVDPKGAFKEFEARVVDAAPSTGMCPTFADGLPNVTGTWLFGGKDRIIAPANDIQFIWTIKYNAGTNTVDTTAQPLDYTTRMRVGVEMSEKNIPVEGCLFKAPFNATVPAVANPINQAEVTLQATIPAYIQSKDFICGSTIEGSVPALSFSLENHDFAMIRIQPGQEGSTLPPSISNCKQNPNPTP